MEAARTQAAAPSHAILWQPSSSDLPPGWGRTACRARPPDRSAIRSCDDIAAPSNPMDLRRCGCFDAARNQGVIMADFPAEAESLGSLVLIEELFHMLAKSGVLPEAKLGDVVRGAVARLDTTDHFDAAAAVRHYFEHWLED
jgi:hypothetical protein